MTRKHALAIGWSAIALAIAVQLFNDLTCYGNSLLDAVKHLWFPAIPLIPGLIAVFGENPIKAIGASLVAITFYAMAYYTDCIRPYEGGGASMFYVVVILYGTPLAFIATWLVGFICRQFGVTVEKR
jgi:hypothetical protein